MKIKKLILLVIILASCQEDSANQTNIGANTGANTGVNAVGSASFNPAPSVVPEVGCPLGFECEDQCRDLFNVRTERESCLKLSAQNIDNLYESLTRRLRTPISSNDLQEITNEGFQDIINKGVRVWSRNIQNYSRQDSQRVLNWLVDKRSYTEQMSQNSVVERVFPELIESVGTPLRYSLNFLETSSENILLRAERVRNTNALRFIHRELVEECPVSKYAFQENRSFRESACVLGEIYCERAGEKYREVYPNLLEVDVNLHTFIVQRDGLNLNDKYTNFEDVCRTLCSRVNCLFQF